jgi:serine/threonine-protein kinase HipA
MYEIEYLNVWHESQMVGKIWCNTAGIIGFSYAKDWLSKGFPISQNLPLQLEEFSPELGAAHQFFVNLLPEADARRHIVRDLKISNSDFGLLKAIGGECAGALSLLPANLMPQNKSSYTELKDDEFNRLLLRKGQVSSVNTGDDRPRLSLAGAQDKCPIFYNGGKFFLPKDASVSTHILKFEIDGYRNIPVYEYFLTQLAAEIGLPVVDIELRKHNKSFYLLIERYDRTKASNGDVIRCHQEDFCQALGFSYQHKYQQQGGPSFKHCYLLLQQLSIRPIQDVEVLIKWQIFNVLAGNSDGHAKNISLLYDKRHNVTLAPLYDLVCTRAIERIDARLAMSVGDEFNPELVLKKHWQQMAEEIDVRYPYLEKTILETAETLLMKTDKMIEEFEAVYGDCSALQRVKMVVTKQCKRALTQLS